MTANPFAALPRYSLIDGNMTRATSGDYVHVSDIATLAAAYPADLAEAGTVLEGAVWVTFNCAPNAGRQPAIVTRDDPGFLPDRFEAARYVPADTITALLARIAAQEAQMTTILNEREGLRLAMEKWVEESETALAAERAKTAKLVEALKPFGFVDEEGDFLIEAHGSQSVLKRYVAAKKRLRAAITEASK